MACHRLASRLGSAAAARGGARRRVGVVVAVGCVGTSLVAPRCAQCELSMAESACCMLSMGALQLGLAARWTLYPEALAWDFGRVPPSGSRLEPTIEQEAVFSKHVDQKSGRTYYCNVTTREVAWELPLGAAVQENEQDDASAQQSDSERAAEA
eukprot:COSAG02_NODE_3211_length_7164_cov_5.234820_7_plen_154_part_00